MSNSDVARKMKVGSFKKFNTRPEAMRLYFAIRRLGLAVTARLETTPKGNYHVYKVRT